jgi:L-iditol 2-dehydrogenase
MDRADRTVINMFELYLDKPTDLKMREATLPSLKDNEVRIKVRYGGICGSDLKVYKGLLPYAHYPCRPGHEILGTVIEAGKDSKVKVGTKIVSFPNTYCGKCEYCLQGKTNVCKEKRSFGVTVDGFFAQEIVLDSEYAVPIPNDIPEERAILIEPFAVNVHALKKAKIGKGTKVAVVGCGTEGLLCTALLTYFGADITVLDTVPAKMEKAKSFGGNIKSLSPADVTDQLFDVVVEAAGFKESIEMAMKIVKPGGALIAFGICGTAVEYPALRITRSEITIFGSIIYTKKDFMDAIDFLKDPAFNVAPVLSKIVPYTTYQQAFSDALTGNFAKIVLDFKEA